MKIINFLTLNLFHSSVIHTIRTKKLAEIISQHIPSGSGLDIGSGDGKIASLIVNEKKELTIKCMDIPNHANKDKNNILLYDGEKIPYDNNTFDFVLLIDVLHHCTKPDKIFEEAIRVSKNLIIIKDHITKNIFDNAILKLMDWFGNSYRDISSQYKYLSMEKWLNLFNKNKMNIKSHIIPKLYKFPVSMIARNNLQVIFILDKNYTTK